MIVWEYKTYHFEAGESLREKLNQFGAEGWEAFHFMSHKAIVVFKRQKPPPTEEKTQ